MDNSLIKLNFAPGIKAKDVNYNFDIVHGWVKRERRRVGGPGLVNGFDLSADLNNFTVTVGSGVMVNQDGEEVFIDGKTFSVGAPEYTSRKERFVCPVNGMISLGSRPYSPTNKAYIDYAKDISGLDNLPSPDEFYITCEAENRRVYYTQINENNVYVSKPEIWLDKKLTFNYFTAEDRVDAIILYPDGHYLYQKSVVADSPSHVDISDYPKGCMLIGVIHWVIDTRLDVKFYTNHRSYRNLYVDEDDQLYINGKPYKQAQMIYFDPPEDPQENDLWYDRDSNCLMVWRETMGDWGWVQINDVSSIVVKEHKFWKPEDWPADNQTFLFGDDETNLHFVPNTNSLQIIIDNCVLMSDQFTEIVSTAHEGAPDYMAQGIGFKLKDPMDRPTYMDVIISQRVRSKPARETFQRAAIFIDENHAFKQTENTAQIFKTQYPYVVGANQLEVWVDGTRLVPGLDFVEMVDANTIALPSDGKDQNKMCQFYKVMKPLADGQLVDYRVSKYVWSYDQVAQLLKDETADIMDLKAQCKALAKDLSNTNAHVAHQLDTLAKQLDKIQGGSGTGEENVPIEASSIMIAQLAAETKSRLVGKNQFDRSMPATSLDTIANATTSDFIQIHLISASESRILIRNIDYTLADTPNGLRIDLSPEFAVSGNTIYVTGFQIGV